MESAKNKYFNSLTGLRFLAATLVFVFHNRKYWRPYFHPEFLRLVNEFHIGVSLFFVLSGFLIAYTYYDDPVHSSRKYTKYLLLRIARIMPLYWLILTAYYIDPQYGKYQFNLLTYSLFHAFSNLKNLEGISQAWSLNVEMSFYLIAPLLYYILRKKLAYLLGALVGLFAATIIVGYTWHHFGNSLQFFYPIKFIVNATFPGRSIQFLAGMLLAYGLREEKYKFFFDVKHKTLWGFMLLFIVTYCIGLCQKNIYVSGDETILGMILHCIVLPFSIVFIISGLMTEKTWMQYFFSSKLMVLLGNASFTFYLIHISYVNLKIREYIQLPDRNFVVLWIASIAIYLLIEKPFYTLCRKWINKIPVTSTNKKNNIKKPE